MTQYEQQYRQTVDQAKQQAAAAADTAAKAVSRGALFGSIALILGVDRFMSEARALTNLVGNGVATVVVSRWEGALDVERMKAHLNNETEAEADTPEQVLVEDDIKEAGPPRPVTT